MSVEHRTQTLPRLLPQSIKRFFLIFFENACAPAEEENFLHRFDWIIFLSRVEVSDLELDRMKFDTNCIEYFKHFQSWPTKYCQYFIKYLDSFHPSVSPKHSNLANFPFPIFLLPLFEYASQLHHIREKNKTLEKSIYSSNIWKWNKNEAFSCLHFLSHSNTYKAATLVIVLQSHKHLYTVEGFFAGVTWFLSSSSIKINATVIQ